MTSDSSPDVIIDVAGAAIGGSRRFLLELDDHIAMRRPSEVAVVGRHRRLTPAWLVQREALARRSRLRVALNNASFAWPTSTNVTLLRNVLHFPLPREFENNSFRPSLELRAQIPVVQRLARRSDVLVCPTSAMASRVATADNALASRLVVKPHPVTPRPWAGTAPSDPLGILVPIVPSPYKHLGSHVAALAKVAAALDANLRILVTASPNEIPEASSFANVRFLGRLDPVVLDRYWETSQTIYYPTSLEAFGYPLAEARANGRYVVAQDTDHNREVAGDALSAYTLHDIESLTAALEVALSGHPRPEAAPFEPDDYFRWLFSL